MSAFVSPETYYGAMCLITFVASTVLATVEYRGGLVLDQNEAKWPRS